MTPQILYRLSPGTPIPSLIWDSGRSASATVFLGIATGSAVFRTTVGSVFNFPAPPVGTVLFIPTSQVQSIGL